MHPSEEVEVEDHDGINGGVYLPRWLVSTMVAGGPVIALFGGFGGSWLGGLNGAQSVTHDETRILAIEQKLVEHSAALAELHQDTMEHTLSSGHPALEEEVEEIKNELFEKLEEVVDGLQGVNEKLLKICAGNRDINCD